MLFSLFILPQFLYAQEATPPPPVEVQVLTPEQNRIDMDIRTSTLSELASWCRSLGLSEGGTAADLARRLREHFRISERSSQGEDRRKTITIESARSSEYFTIEAIDEDYARLSGEVRISLKDGDAVHQIRAWDILFNRTRNILTASGGVEYIKTEGDKVETFRGDSITVDIDNWSSIFLGGVSERSLQSDSTTYQFAGTVISRDEEDVTILSRASIRSANNEESLWSLNASRVWLLPGSDFAILNAVLKVGEIPVLYVPFFYYPADEVIFHPVIGSRTREGTYVQTTMYILGRPKASSSTQSSLTKILGNSNDMEKRREGLFLRSTGKKATDPDKVSLKAMVDWYANLGVYVGTDLVLPAKGILGAINLNMGIGLTRTVANVGNVHTPFFPDYNGDTDWNYSNLFSMEVPLRYRFKTDSSISGKYGSFSWNLPFYSDPVVDSDFLNRAEDMDWVNMIQQGAAAAEAQDSTQNHMGNYSWQFSGQLRPNFPNMTPYITGISISTISTSVSFRTNDARPRTPSGTIDTNNIQYWSPSSYFYAPDTATLYSLSSSIAGTPISLGGSAATQSAAAAAKNAERPDPLKDIGVPRSPFDDSEQEDSQKKDQSDKLVPPELVQRFDLPRVGNTRFSVDYRIAPSSASTLTFDYNKWKVYSDINWGEISSILTNVGGDASTTLNVNHSENLFTNTFSYSGNGSWRNLYMNTEAEAYQRSDGSGEIDENKINNERMQQSRQTFFSTSYNVTSSLRPLYQNDIFKSSSLQYSLRGIAVRSKFDEENSTGDNPKWDMEYGEWKKEKVDTHQFSTNISALIMDKTQTISLTTDLPPRAASIAWRASFRIWITETDANMRILFPEEEEERKLEPFNLTERIVFGTFGNLSQTLVLNTESKELTTLTSSLNLTKWGFSASYSATRMLGFEYIPLGSDENALTFEGWRTRAGKAEAGDPNFQLRSRDFIMNFSKTWSMTQLWDNRLQFSVNIGSRLFLDLQRYTSSNFTFNLGFTVKVNNFLDLTLSTNSENAYIYRYLKDMPFFSDAPIEIPDGPQNNFFLDLVNSFRFDDEELRKISGYKIKNFRISATHFLGDWNATLTWSMFPSRATSSRPVELINDVSFLVQWIPISEIKSDISYDKRNSPEWRVRQ
ncbi:MAG: LPS-assembly protein LptD [Treponema sp.]|nr:LPS-assembly protein LptD [Treponema sp.]